MPRVCEPRRSYHSSSPISIVTGCSSGSSRARARRIGTSFSRPSCSRYCTNGGALRARRAGCLPVSPGCFPATAGSIRARASCIGSFAWQRGVPASPSASAFIRCGTASSRTWMTRISVFCSKRWVAKQPGLTGRHPSLLARNAPPFAQYLEKDGRENDIPILFAYALFDPDDHPVTIDIGELERYDLRGSQAGGISQAQERLVLDVYCRGEQPTDLFRAENNGQAARLAGRDELLGKIVALQRDLEEEPQGSGTDVDGRYRRADRRQPQLIAMNILGGGLVGRTAQKIGKPFDVADIVELRLGAKPAD